MKRSALIINMILITCLTTPLSAQVLNVSKITQTQNQWCWAGVSACVLEFYGKSVSQCVIAEYTRTVEQFSDISFGLANCCTSPATCNNWNYNWGGPGSIEDILLHFASITNNNIGSSITLSSITTSIQANRPFIIRWALTAGGGHFVVGHGISGENIYYMNPWPGEGKKIATYAWVQTASDHSWTHTNTFTVSPQPPAAAGTISGITTVCQGQASVTYSVPPIDRALTYLWTIPEGAKGASTTESITLAFSPAAVSGPITVTGQNNLGNGTTSTLPVTVNPLPAPAGAISGNALVCQRQRDVTYTVPVISHAISYIWTVTVDATGTSTTNKITLNFGLNTSLGTISVKGKNDCGEGEEYAMDIKLSGIPETPVITQKGNDLTSSSLVGNQWYNSSGPIEGATSRIYTITASDDYYVVVTIDGCSSDPSETLSLILNGTDTKNWLSRMMIYPNPATGQLEIEASGSSEPVIFRILNSLGQSLYQSILVNHAVIDLSDFPPGIYLIKFETGKEISVRKFLKE
ncbi:MAG: T9SS type A sorting domain-containing protein [Bacteroidia bacterium]|nr:T9SS type A sorting domain-containing protein [Bacteroidia bacterium]